MKKWILYNIIVVFAVYWMSNLILWFPWSINEALGMTLMLTVSPAIWAYATYLCLRSFPNPNFMMAAVYNSVIFLLLAVVMDYIFFGLIRNAMEQLYHPTTFYGYGFVLSLPFMIALGFKKRIARNRRNVIVLDFVKAILVGLACFVALVLIIVLDITL